MLTMQVIGNLGADPAFKETQGGTKMCSFSIAVNKKVKGEKQTTWVSVTVFDERKIEFIRDYVRKGSKLFLEGEPRARAYEKDGDVRSSLDLTLGFGSKIEICSSERADSPAPMQGSAAPATAGGGGWNEDLNDEVPW